MITYNLGDTNEWFITVSHDNQTYSAFLDAIPGYHNTRFFCYQLDNLRYRIHIVDNL